MLRIVRKRIRRLVFAEEVVRRIGNRDFVRNVQSLEQLTSIDRESERFPRLRVSELWTLLIPEDCPGLARDAVRHEAGVVLQLPEDRGGRLSQVHIATQQLHGNLAAVAKSNAVDPWLAQEIVRVCLELRERLRFVPHVAKRPVAHGLDPEVPVVILGRIEVLQQVLGEADDVPLHESEGVRRVGGHPNGVLVQHLPLQLRWLENQMLRVREEAEREVDVGSGHRHAVVPARVLAQVVGPRATVLRTLPALGKPRIRLTALAHANQRGKDQVAELDPVSRAEYALVPRVVKGECGG